MSGTFWIMFWVVFVGVAFAYFWWQGNLQQLTTYVRQTWEELKKCSWPTWEELKGSTAVVVISIFLLGGFTALVDQILFYVFITL
jgi:preprotein translocase subunit SecE